MRKLALIAALATLATGSAGAADIYYKPSLAPIVPAWSWSGIYIGGVAGVALTKDSLEFPGVIAAPNGLRAAGWLAGGSMTARWQMPATPIVIGAEAIGAWANSRGANDFCLAAGCDVKSSFFGAALGQAGITLGGLPVLGAIPGQSNLGNMLLYASGGAVWRRTSIVTMLGSEAWTKTGVAVGGGLDVPITPNIVFGVQYLHSFYRSGACDGCVAGLVPTETKFSDDLIMGSLKLKLY